MGKDKTTKIILLSILFLFLFVSAASSVSAYGGGGKNPAEESDSAIGATPPPKKLSDEDLKKIFILLGAHSAAEMAQLFSGTGKTKRELMTIRQAILEGRSNAADFDASLLHGLTVTVEFLDEAGQWSELGLSFVPGVGMTTQAVLAAARGGADAHKKGEGIIKGAIIKAVTSVTINHFSPLDADKALKSAAAAGRLTRKALMKEAQKRYAKYYLKAKAAGLTQKEAERRAGNALESFLNYMTTTTKKASNRAQQVAGYNPSAETSTHPSAARPMHPSMWDQ